MRTDQRRIWLAIAGLYGAAGVALAARAAHGGGDTANIEIASRFLLIHALALMGVAALTPRGRWLVVAGALMALGALLFSGGLVILATIGPGLGFVIPIGGTGMILGWIALALSALLDRRE